MRTTAAQRLATRLAAAAILVFAFLAPVWMSTPPKLPAVALGTTWVLYFERSLAILIALLFVLVIVVRSVWQGQVPTDVSREGFKWAADLTRDVRESIDALQKQVKTIEGDMDALVDWLAETRP